MPTLSLAGRPSREARRRRRLSQWCSRPSLVLVACAWPSIVGCCPLSSVGSLLLSTSPPPSPPPPRRPCPRAGERTALVSPRPPPGGLAVMGNGLAKSGYKRVLLVSHRRPPPPTPLPAAPSLAFPFLFLLLLLPRGPGPCLTRPPSRASPAARRPVSVTSNSEWMAPGPPAASTRYRYPIATACVPTSR